MNSSRDFLLSSHSDSRLQIRSYILDLISYIDLIIIYLRLYNLRESLIMHYKPRTSRELVAAQLQGDLEVVGCEVVEVLHPATHGVPGGAVGNPAVLGELVNRGVTAGGPGV